MPSQNLGSGVLPENFDVFSPDLGSASSAMDMNNPWDYLITGSYENSSFFDLDSLVSGGMNFGWGE